MADQAWQVDAVAPTPYRGSMYAPRSIVVGGFKSIQKQELSLRPLNLLIGANGAGKSNLISLFTLVSAIAQENLQTYVARQGGANALLHFGSRTTDHLEIDLKFAQNRYRAALAPTTDDTLVFEREDCWGSGYAFSDYQVPLHPYAITLLAGLLQAAAASGATVIASTQSVPLVNQFTPEDVVVVERREGQSTFSRLPAEGFHEWLDEYGLGDLWEKNLLGGRPVG